jgi:mannose-1-phosphate guanylyltransferase
VAVYLKQGAGCKGKITCRFSLVSRGMVNYMQTMLLAAGLGTRLRPYTLIRPKPLFPVLNRPLLLILLDMLGRAGSGQIVVNGHHLGGQVERAVAGRENAFYQHEPEILGTGGSLRQALPRFADEPLLVMNGDIFHTIDLADLYSHHVRSGNRITMAMHDCPRFNTVAVRDGYVRAFSSGQEQEIQEHMAFTGIHVVDPAIISMIPARQFFHIIDLYEELIGQGEKIGCLRVDGAQWQDIGTAEDYLELHAGLLTGTMENSVPLPLPEGKWLVSREAGVQQGVRLSGWGCIGKADIGCNVHLRNCVVWDNAIVPDNTRAENAILNPALTQ